MSIPACWCAVVAVEVVVAPAGEPFVNGLDGGSPGLWVIDVSVNANSQNLIGLNVLRAISGLLID